MMRYLAIPLILLPVSGMAEGAVLSLDCAVATRCDRFGECGVADDRFAARVAPRATDADGAGTYTVSLTSGDRPANATGRLGPFVWTDGPNVTDVLSVTGDTTALLVHRDTRPDAPDTPLARVDFMTCEVTF